MKYLQKKNDLFQKKKIIKINGIYKMAFDSVKLYGTNKFPAAKYSIVGKYSTQKAPLRDDRIQPVLVWKFWVQRYEVLIYEIWQKELKIGPQTFKYLLNMIFPGIDKMAFFNWFFICITVLGISRYFQGSGDFLQLERFTQHFIYSTRKKGSAGKIFRVFPPRKT